MSSHSEPLHFGIPLETAAPVIEERPKQLCLFAPPKPLTERFGAAFFRTIPKVPGVYRMFADDGRLLYIGQSHNLRERLNSYRHVHPDRDSRKTVRLVHAVRRIEWEICDSPASARLRENELLRTLRPRFNRMNVWPWACFYIGWREEADTLALTLRRAPAAGWNNHGAFRGGARFGFGALVRLLAVTRETADAPPPTPETLATKIPTRAKFVREPANDDALPELADTDDTEPLLPFMNAVEPAPVRVAARAESGAPLAPLLRAYLEGESPELIALLLESVSRLRFEHRFAEALLLDELATLESFFRTGPQRILRLKILHGLPPGLLAPEKFLDLLAVTETTSV